MKILLIAFLPLGSCGGSFCQIYSPLDMNRDAATALVQLDRPAAEAAAVNEESYRGCP